MTRKNTILSAACQAFLLADTPSTIPSTAWCNLLSSQLVKYCCFVPLMSTYSMTCYVSYGVCRWRSGVTRQFRPVKCIATFLNTLLFSQEMCSFSSLDADSLFQINVSKTPHIYVYFLVQQKRVGRFRKKTSWFGSNFIWEVNSRSTSTPRPALPRPAPPVRGLPALLSTSLPDAVQWCIFCINFCDRCCLATLLADGACLCLILLRKVLSSRVTNWRHPVACHTAAEGGFWCRCLTRKSLRTVRTDSLVTKSAHILDQ